MNSKQTKQLKRHIRKIRFNWFLVSIFSLIAAGCIASSIYLTEYLYDKWQLPDGTYQQQEANIQRAIDLHPTRIDGYFRLLQLYTEDEVLTEAESEQFQLVLKGHQARLNKNPDDVNQLYKSMAFSYLTQYDADVQTRFRQAYIYFQRSTTYSGQELLEDAAADTYLTIGRYYSEYIWPVGTAKEPSTLEISDTIRQLSTMADTYIRGSLAQRLAYSCTVADILENHGQLWLKKINATSVDALIDKIIAPLDMVATSETEKRLQTELSAWYGRWKEAENGN